MPTEDLDLAQFGTAFQNFMEAVTAAASAPNSPLLERIEAHLGADPTQLPIIAEQYDAFEHPNLQVALDEYTAGEGRHADLIGVGADNKRYMVFGLSDLVSRGRFHGHSSLTLGPVDYTNFHLADDRVLSCVQFGIYLIQDRETRLVVFVAGPSENSPNQKLRVEVLVRLPEQGQAFLLELTDAMMRLNVYRGHIISLSPGQFGPGPHTLIAFHTLPYVARDDVILPNGVLERIERQTIVFGEQAERLQMAGRSLKRGLLVYGPPGVGKTLTVEYLVGRMPGRTVLLTAGFGLGFIQPIAQLARSLAPSMVVLEDVDLIAEQRGMPDGHAGPLLFELLNEMDGLRDDSDIIFLLTTNRPEILEAALAARPGRIDLAVELPLPDAPNRRRLLELYARGLDLRDVDLDAIAARIESATPAYIKELLRKAAVLAAAEGPDLVVTDSHLEMALTELDEGGRLAQSLLGFHSTQEPSDTGLSESSGAMTPTGFPPPVAGIARTYRTSGRRR
jgi:DNA polymerase III delta prime subunit